MSPVCTIFILWNEKECVKNIKTDAREKWKMDLFCMESEILRKQVDLKKRMK